MDGVPPDLVTLRTDVVAYLFKENWTKYEDVFIYSRKGEKFGFNRLMLAAVSWVCKRLFAEVYECPLANLDEHIHISSNFTSKELSSLRNFLLNGRPQKSRHGG